MGTVTERLFSHPYVGRVILLFYWPALACGTHWPKLKFDLPQVRDAPPIVPDKLGHFVAFGLLALWLIMSIRGKRRLWLGVLIALVYTVIDETTQQWFDRQVSWQDWVPSASGAISCGLVWWFLSHSQGQARWRIGARLALVVVLPMVLVMTTLPGFYLAYYFPSPFGAAALHALAGVMGVVLFMMAGLPARWAIMVGVAGIGAAMLGINVTWIDVAGYVWGLLFVSALVVIEWWAGRVGSARASSGDARGVTNGDASSDTVTEAERAGVDVGVDVDVDAERVEQVEQVVAAEHVKEVADEKKATPHFVGHAKLVALLTLVSRFTGLGRDALLGAVYGLGGVGDAFVVAFMIPHLFRRLFGEGALSAAFIPVYSKLLGRQRMTAKRLATLLVTVLLIGLAGVTLIGEMVLLIMQRFEWSDSNLLAIRLTMVMLPYMPLVCATALIGGVLQVHGKFGPPAAAPVLLNLVMIVVLVWVGFFSGGVLADTSASHSVMFVAIAVIVAGLMQLGWQWWAWRGVQYDAQNTIGNAMAADNVAISAAENTAGNAEENVGSVGNVGNVGGVEGVGGHLKRVLWLMGPMVIGLAVFQINTLADVLIAKGFSSADPAARFSLFGHMVAYPMDEGAAIALSFAQRLYQFPLGVFGVAIATAIFPMLAKYAGRDSQGRLGEHANEFADTLRHGLRLTLFIGLPASVGLILVRGPLTRVIFGYGEIDAADVSRIAIIMTGYAMGVWAYAMTHVVTRAFYAQQDARTPLRVSVGMVLCNITMNLTLIGFLGAAGLAWSTAICATAQVVLLLRLIGRDVTHLVDASVWRSWLQTIVLSIVMAAALLGVRGFLPTHVVGLLVMVVVGAAVVAGGSRLLKMDEPVWLLRRRSRG